MWSCNLGELFLPGPLGLTMDRFYRDFFAGGGEFYCLLSAIETTTFVYAYTSEGFFCYVVDLFVF